MKPKDAQAAEAIAKLIGYLQRHQERLDYRFARKGGYPMGSGGIESANTFVCHVRLKRSGAWWDCGQRQPDAGLALRQIQWDRRPDLGSLPAEGARAIRTHAS
jgi:hypothetical protein